MVGATPFALQSQRLANMEKDKDIHILNRELYPFLDMNEGNVSDYIDMQRLKIKSRNGLARK